MRIQLHCPRCTGDDYWQWLEEMVDNGLYRTVCPNGHKNIVLLQVHKFEVLFELAINAIVDGYYRDAVASLTAALERFYEFYANVICESGGVSEDTFAKCWKNVGKHSERQLGAFILLYLARNYKAPPLLSENDEVRFRNQVVHQGLIPTRDQAMKYGERVYEIISTVLDELKSTDHGTVLKVASVQANKPFKEIEKEPNVTLLVPWTAIGVNRPRDPLATFAKAVESARARMANAKKKGRNEQ